MRFLRVGESGEERPVVLDAAGRYFDLTGLTTDIDGRFLAGGGIEAVRAALLAGTLPETDVSDERIGAPIARPPAVLCIGMNYAAHAAESGAMPPDNPVLFQKHPNTVVGPHDPIVVPRNSAKTDWEVELGVVIGTRAGYLDSPDDAAGVIAGYVLSNDVSERAYQLEVSGGQWSKGKSCASFNPLGPWLVTADEVGDAAGLRMFSRVNGEQRQDSSTADMIFDVPFLVWHLSQYLVLEPGDLLNTGTPEGVALSGRFPYLSAGDTVEIGIDKLGTQRSVCVNAPGALARERP
jgi:2-keto-4-pentenoate hydratase/2-oxohepta-3-ene-1,7-dioic acid hydratase in catechol pathway